MSCDSEESARRGWSLRRGRRGGRGRWGSGLGLLLRVGLGVGLDRRATRGGRLVEALGEVDGVARSRLAVILALAGALALDLLLQLLLMRLDPVERLRIAHLLAQLLDVVLDRALVPRLRVGLRIAGNGGRT